VLIKGTFVVGDWKLDCAARLSFSHFLTIEQLIAPLIPRRSRRYLGFLPGPGLWWRRELLRGHLRSWWPQKVICVSNAVRARLVAEYRFPGRKLVTVWNGIDVERFRPDPALGEACRREWGVPSGALVFGAVGRFAEMKGYPVALAGFQRLLSRFPDRDVWLLLVGEGDQEQSLRALAERIQPRGRVVFAPFSHRPWGAFSAIDIFLMPSLSEGLPQALLEAMACECCPVASAAGGVPEVLSDPRLGWVVPIGETEAFAAAMIDAASRTAEERAIMGKRARSHVEANFNGIVQFQALVDVLESFSQAQPSPWRP
jgi:glycosyltransferase involved in cell wall biosynthesis